ncbi:odorant receptor 4-like isoform X2 [Photinus pyralis]|nr:odorant receptor 4-like isoform X2 [Photinus pyralis]
MIVTNIRNHNYHGALAFGSLNVLNISYSPNYEIISLYQTIVVFYVSVYYISVDLIATGLLVHIAFQFKMVQNNFQRVVYNAYREMCKSDIHDSLSLNFETFSKGYETVTPLIRWKYLRSSLQKAAKYHAAVLRLMNDMEEMFSLMYLVQFSTLMIVMCFEIYNATAVDNTLDIIFSLAQCVTLLLQLLLTCFWAEYVLHEGVQVSSAVYHSHFVGTDVRFQKGLVLVIQRSQREATLTAGNMATVKLATMAWIIKSAYSAFMMMRSLK